MNSSEGETVPIELRFNWYGQRGRDFKGLKVLNLRGFNWGKDEIRAKVSQAKPPKIRNITPLKTKTPDQQWLGVFALPNLSPL